MSAREHVRGRLNAIKNAQLKKGTMTEETEPCIIMCGIYFLSTFVLLLPVKKRDER